MTPTEVLTDEWAKPHEISDLDVVFASGALEHMPSREECREGLSRLKDKGRSWIRFQTDWFFNGLPEGTKITPNKGIDLDAAMRHLKMIQGSFAPKHEHKVGAVAYLASRWLKSVRMPS